MSLFMTDQPSMSGQFGRIFAVRPQWLAGQQAEQPLEPEIPIIDTHHHLWDYPNNRYLIDEISADLHCGHNIVATVFLECNAMWRQGGPASMRPVGETEFVAGIAAMSDSGGYGSTRIAQAIVGFADLALGEDVRPVLEAHIHAGGGRFKGIRYATGWDANPVIGNSHSGSGPHVLRRPEVRQGLRELANLRLSFDAWVFHPQLADVIEVAHALPDLSIVMGHCGGPLGYGPYAGRKEQVFSEWKASMTEMAKCPNVVVKLGGMLMRLAAFDYLSRPEPPSSVELAQCWDPYVSACIELFGADRCMFESNFPVEKMGTGSTVMWNAFKRIVAGASAAEKLALFSGTARRIYALQ
jgi:predicted TIM-barrel fold metal-dependent hydrolase